MFADQLGLAVRVDRAGRMLLVDRQPLWLTVDRRATAEDDQQYVNSAPAVLQKEKTGRVLEVGTGCGYQAAVLAHVFPEVYSIERIKGLLERARANLLALRLKNLRLVHGDGYAGLEKARAVPVDRRRGRGAAHARGAATPARARWQNGAAAAQRKAAAAQRLVLVERNGRGFVESELDAVRFVPMEAGKA